MAVKRFTLSFCFFVLNLISAECAGGSPMGLAGSHLNAAGKLRTRIVSTKYGDLRGFVTNLPNKQLSPVEVFLGVPYASPPMSALRFMPPVTPSHWKGTRAADKFSPVCPQKLPDLKNETDALTKMSAGRLEYLKKLMPYLKNQSEDCLYLNIYAPQKSAKDTTRSPVLVFIHGESYDWNAGNPYDGSVLASFGKVLVVTVNFRLGVLGFLPVMEGSARGNYGLTDQVAALHWIQENIAEFGGDPKNVTLFGHGHGAACINFLVLSPMSKGSTLFPTGLFHRAIMMSGSALSPWALARDANSYAQKMARTLGCPEKPAALLECFRQRSVEDILRVEIDVPMFLTGFGPTIDGIVIQNEPSTMLKDLADEQQPLTNFDLMFGVTRVEGYNHISEKDEKSGMEMNRRDKLLRTLVRNIFSYHLQEIFLTIVNEYTDWTKAIQHDLSVLDGTLDALGDALVVAPVVKTANYYTTGPRKAFFYVLSYQLEDGKFPQRHGCVTGEDLQYVFGTPLIGSLGPYSRNYSQADISFSEAVMTYWVNFARNGDPNPVQSDRNQDRTKGRFDKVVWPAYDNSHQRYITLNVKPKIRDHYHSHRLSFWLNLFPLLHTTSSTAAAPEHHLLDDHHNPQSYHGTVRQIPWMMSAKPAPTTSAHQQIPRRSHAPEASTIEPEELIAVSTVDNVTMFPTGGSNVTDKQGGSNDKSFLGLSPQALVITISVGASLLALNVVIFVAIIYTQGSCCTKKRPRVETVSLDAQEGHDYLDNQMSSIAPLKAVCLRAPPPSPVCHSIIQQQEFTLLPPSQRNPHPPKPPPKPCLVPTPPTLNPRESLVDDQPLLAQSASISVVSTSPIQQYKQNAQVHFSHNHHEIKL